jgi:ribosomal-protein-alanine N-acetyltransferase
VALGYDVTARLVCETPRLRIRRVEAADAAALAGFYADPEVMAHLGGARERERMRRVFEEIARAPEDDEERIWSLLERGSGAVIGCCGLVRKEIDRRVEYELTYTLARPFWGRGLATEAAGALRDHAVSALGLRRLVALIEPEHHASASVARKVGFELEGSVTRPGPRTLLLYAFEPADRNRSRRQPP